MPYIPDKGDIIWLDFNPQIGREQAGRRPALVISPAEYNGKVRLALVCPFTNRVKGYPFEVPVPSGMNVSGVVLSDQLKSIDWHIRKAEFICKAPHEMTDEVIARLKALLPE